MNKNNVFGGKADCARRRRKREKSVGRLQRQNLFTFVCDAAFGRAGANILRRSAHLPV
jgi:hypothetical protein